MITQCRQSLEKGAAMVEMAVVGLFFFLVIGFLLDLMVVYFKNQVLASAVTRGTRSFAINFPDSALRIGNFNNPDENDTIFYEDKLSNAVRDQIIRHINQNYIGLNNTISPDVFAVRARVSKPPAGVPPVTGNTYISVDVHWQNVCIFCFFNLTARATAQSVIEDECFF
jgi:hypothetical protein